jgi:hypothetical protein
MMREVVILRVLSTAEINKELSKTYVTQAKHSTGF